MTFAFTFRAPGVVQNPWNTAGLFPPARQGAAEPPSPASSELTPDLVQFDNVQVQAYPEPAWAFLTVEHGALQMSPNADRGDKQVQLIQPQARKGGTEQMLCISLYWLHMYANPRAQNSHIFLPCSTEAGGHYFRL